MKNILSNKMKIKSVLVLWSAVSLLAATAEAGVRSSANYSILSDTMAAGGGSGASLNYGSDVAISGPCGTGTGRPSLPPVVVVVIHGGPIPQRPDLKSFGLGTPLTSINENTALTLSAGGQYDDDTFVDLTSTGVRWSGASPLVVSPTNGLLSVEPVYGDTVADLRADYLGWTAKRQLRVVNSASDNFGTYAGDGLNDSWQVRNFGLNHPAAGPDADPDADGQDNRYEYIAGTAPTEPSSRFALRIDPVPGQPAWRNLTFGPIANGRSYQLQHRPALTSGFTPFGKLPATTNGSFVVVTDTNATSAVRFYRVRIVGP